MGLAIGIDLGTTNTVVGAVVNGVAVTLADEKKRRLIPSIVAFTPAGLVLVGEAARESRITDPANAIYSVKRLIGRPFGAPEVQYIAQRFPFKVVRGDKDATMVVAQGTPYALPEISAFVLRRAKKVAETALGEKVDRAVITVPASFNDLQRAATKLAGKLAGLDVLRILNEPTAAALAYGQAIEENERIVVYDLGGGTFDITLLDLHGNVFEVLATAGDTALGGDDLDTLVAERLADQVKQAYGVDTRRDPTAFGRLRFAAEVMKRELSVATVVEHEIRDVVFSGSGAPLGVRGKLTRIELDALALPFADRTLEVTRQSLAAARLAASDFSRVILVGGSTRMPLIARRVGEFFAQPPSVRVNPDEVVALGAAIQAHALVRTKGDRQKSRDKPATSLEAFPASSALGAPLRTALSALPSQSDAEDHARPTTRVKALSPLEPGPDLSGAPSPTMPVLLLAAPDIRDVPPSTVQARTKRDLRAEDDDFSPTIVPSFMEETLRSSASPVVPRRVPLEGAPETEPRRSSPAASAPVPTFAVPDLPVPSAAARLGVDALGVSAHLQARVAGAPSSVTIAAHSSEREAPAVGDDPRTAPPPSPDDPRIQPMAVYAPNATGNIRAWPAMPLQEPSVERTMPVALWGPIDVQGAGIVPDPGADEAHVVPTGGILARERAALLVDVTPLSLLVETVGGYCDVLIASNTPVPCDKTRVFRTAQDNQTRVTIRVAQGASNRFAENTYLGELELSGIRAGKRGEAAIGVTFELDADGILNVKARERASGIETHATLRSFAALNEASDIAAMVGRQAQREVL